MMGSDFYFRDKIPIAILGATTKVGQKLVQLLAHHPWFQIASLYDSLNLVEAPLACPLVFSALHSQEAMAIEKNLAKSGCYVISCMAHQPDDLTSLIVAEINATQLAIRQQKGGIVVNPQSLAIALSLALKPLIEKFGLEQVKVNASLSQESERSFLNQEIAQQTLDILGPFQIHVQSPSILKGEIDRASVSMKLNRQTTLEEIIQTWRKFGRESQRLPLPTAPFHILYYLDDPSQPYSLDKEMSVYLEHLSSSSAFDYQFDLFFSHMMRGSAGSMLLNAELLVIQGKIYW